MKPSSTVIKDKKGTEKISNKSKTFGFGASDLDHLKNCLQDSNTMTKDTNDQSCSSSGSQTEILSECPFNGRSCPYGSRVPPLKRRYNHINGLCGVSDVDVICDGCEVHSVDGPLKSKLKYDNDMCSICSEEMGQDVDVRIKLPVVSCRSSHLNNYHDQVDLIPPTVRNDKKGPDVPNTDIDQDTELCENRFIGVVETEDLFFNAKSHKDQETNVSTKNISLTSTASVSKSNSDPAPNALEVPNGVQSPSSIDPFEELEDLGVGDTKRNNEVLRINNYDYEPIDLYQIYFQNPKDY